MSILELRQVSRSFGATKALDRVSFQVQPGRLTGFVGANGAGKTTAMRIGMGVLSADAGQVTWDGKPVTRAIAGRFGYMPEERGLYPKMGVRQQLVFLARLHGLAAAEAERNADNLLDRLGLAARAQDHVEKLSLGNQQRAQIAAALVHDPVALILDEPFSGLDPMAVDVVMGVLRQFAAGGAPILFSSHQLDVVERITDDLIIIAAGQIKAAGATAALRQAQAGSRYRLVLREMDDAVWLAQFPGLTGVRLAPGSPGSASPFGPPGTSGPADPPGPAGAAPGAGAGGGATASDIEIFFEAAPDVAQAALREAARRGPVAAFGRVVPPLSEVFKEVVA
ncbi:MAG: ATP-binding cassette domain-containing protein [Bifidobacteriaceae bacterium]|jgi:ABC-2 type transport system ATP-binding protein|nr:ATP-binding cassette domain-containing protein [Bifidobacteriaceae bacterium]